MLPRSKKPKRSSLAFVTLSGAATHCVVTKTIIAVLLAISASLMAGETPPVRGRLCVAGRSCIEHLCGEPVDMPEGGRRAFTFTSDKGVRLGFIEPGRSAIRCAALDSEGTLNLRISPVNARVEIGPWTIDLPSSKPFPIVLPRGEHVLKVEAPQHAAFRKAITLGSEPLSVAAELEPFPQLSGRVVTAEEGKPVAGALIKTDTTDAVTTDTTGRFALTIDPEQWPTQVTVDAIGFGETSLYVPRPRVNTALGDVRLVPGASITVDVRGVDTSFEVALEKRVAGRVEGAPYKRMSGAHGTFTGVAPGAYVVLVEGSGSCQRHGTLVDVAAGERKNVAIAIEPFLLHVRTSMAGQPMPLTSVVLRNHDFHWQGELKTDSAGEATIGLWQGGKSTIWLAEKNVMTVPYRDDRELANGKDADWPIDIPRREIEGLVVDAQTGDPVANAAVALRVQDVENGVGVHTKTDAQGRFRFVPAPYGRHILKAASSDHMPAEISYTFVDPEQSRQVTLRLDAAVKVRITIQDQSGQPLPAARVMQFRNGVVAGAGSTNADGTIDIPAAKDELRDLYIVPRDGSFVCLQIRDDQPQVVRVPAGTGRLLIRIETTSHEPAAGTRVGMSFNGRPLPREVMNMMAQVRGVTTSTAADGRIVFDRMPPGVYELSTGRGAATRIAVGPGENELVITLPE